MDLNISFRNRAHLLLCFIIATSYSAFGNYNNDKTIGILDLLNGLDALNGHNKLADVESGIIGNPDDEILADGDMYDFEESYPDNQRALDQESGYVDFREKRAWEEINWKPPKRAWGIGKRAWEMLDAWKGKDKWKVKGKRNKERVIDVPTQNSDTWPWVGNDLGYDVIDDVTSGYLSDLSGNSGEKRSWEADRGLFRCSCCSKKAASACCSLCKTLTTYKRSFNFENTESLRSLSCRCCKSVWYQRDECCIMCKLLLGSDEKD